jgi:putative transposase
VLRRKTGRPRFTTLDRVLLATASRVMPRDRWPSFLVTPQTLPQWHRELVRRKWTYRKARTRGRPPIDAEVTALVLRIARENPRWGCVRIRGELRKLGIKIFLCWPIPHSHPARRPASCWVPLLTLSLAGWIRLLVAMGVGAGKSVVAAELRVRQRRCRAAMIGT